MVIAPDYTQIFINYMRDHKLPEGKVEAESHREKQELCVTQRLTIPTGYKIDPTHIYALVRDVNIDGSLTHHRLINLS
jgi:hypothetical protein